MDILIKLIRFVIINCKISAISWTRQLQICQYPSTEHAQSIMVYIFMVGHAKTNKKQTT